MPGPPIMGMLWLPGPALPQGLPQGLARPTPVPRPSSRVMDVASSPFLMFVFMVRFSSLSWLEAASGPCPLDDGDVTGI